MKERENGAPDEAKNKDLDLIKNASLKDFLERVDEILPQDRELFYYSDLDLISKCKIRTGTDEFSFHHSFVRGLADRIKHRKVVRYAVVYEKNRPRIRLNRDGILTIAALFWTSRTLVPNRRGSLNIAKIEQITRDELGEHPLANQILPPDPSRKIQTFR